METDATTTSQMLPRGAPITQFDNEFAARGSIYTTSNPGLRLLAHSRDRLHWPIRRRATQGRVGRWCHEKWRSSWEERGGVGIELWCTCFCFDECVIGLVFSLRSHCQRFFEGLRFLAVENIVFPYACKGKNGVYLYGHAILYTSIIGMVVFRRPRYRRSLLISCTQGAPHLSSFAGCTSILCDRLHHCLPSSPWTVIPPGIYYLLGLGKSLSSVLLSVVCA